MTYWIKPLKFFFHFAFGASMCLQNTAGFVYSNIITDAQMKHRIVENGNQAKIKLRMRRILFFHLIKKKPQNCFDNSMSQSSNDRNICMCLFWNCFEVTDYVFLSVEFKGYLFIDRHCYWPTVMLWTLDLHSKLKSLFLDQLNSIYERRINSKAIFWIILFQLICCSKVTRKANKNNTKN